MKIGLALSGGGALGVAHIGVLEELEKAGIKIGCVCGVSSGAIMGLAYASGGLKSLRGFYDKIIVSDFARPEKFVLAGGPAAAFKFTASVLDEITAGKNLEDLNIPFFCCATNVATGEKDILKSGPAVGAVMASCAYPAVFDQQEFAGNWYIDGGITRNLPAEEARAMGAEFIVGSSIYGVDEILPAKAARMNKIELVFRTLNIFEKELSRCQEKQCDFCFKPGAQNMSWFDFFKMDEILELGRSNAAKQMPKLLEIINKHN